MLIVQLNSNGILIISEYWFLVPLIIGIKIAIIGKIKKNRTQQDLDSQKLEKNFVRWKICNLALENIFSNLLMRGGETTVNMFTDGFIEVSHENCIVANGVQFLDTEWLRKLILVRHSDTVGRTFVKRYQERLVYLINIRNRKTCLRVKHEMLNLILNKINIELQIKNCRICSF